MHEQMFQTVAAGMIADELPKDLISRFLDAIQSASERVYFGEKPVDVDMLEEYRNTGKRPLEETASVESVQTPVVATPVEPAKRKPVAPITKEAPKGCQQLTNFFSKSNTAPVSK